MIETEMVFALGFLSAALLALLCLPAVWRRAVRLSTDRLRQLVPLSADEILAERDQLRAGFAVEQRRLEQRLERANRMRSEAEIRHGRGEARIAALDEEAARAGAEFAALQATLAESTRDLRAMQAESGTAAVALHDVTGLADERLWELQTAQERSRSLQASIDEGRATIASLETRILGLEARIANMLAAREAAAFDLKRAEDRAQDALAKREAAEEALRSFKERPAAREIPGQPVGESYRDLRPHPE